MYSAIERNKRNTWFILILFVLGLGAIGLLAGWLMGNNWWVTAFVLIFAVGYATVQYFAADREALALAGAIEVSREEAPRYYRLVENLCITTGTPMPRLYVVEDAAPNAFATGRKPEEAAITVTTGLFEIMTDRELEGVLSHELGHIRNYDIRVSLIVFGLVVAVGLLADILMRMAFFGGLRRSGGTTAKRSCSSSSSASSQRSSHHFWPVRSRPRSRVNASTSPTQPARSRPATRTASPRRWPSSRSTRNRSAARTRRWHTCGLPTHSALRACRACSQPTRRSQTALNACTRWAASSDVSRSAAGADQSTDKTSWLPLKAMPPRSDQSSVR